MCSTFQISDCCFEVSAVFQDFTFFDKIRKMASTAPTGEVDRSLQQQSLRIIYAFEAVAAVFIALRVWARLLLSKGSWTGLMKLSMSLQIRAKSTSKLTWIR